MPAHFLPKFVMKAASAEYFAFRGHGFSLRSTGRASAGVATGRRVLKLPRGKTAAAGSSDTCSSHRSLRILSTLVWKTQAQRRKYMETPAGGKA